jgi:HAD superfamily hydrolase (TIGR01509 family)
MIKAVIFDLDGLLIDSEPFWHKSDALFLKKRGYIYTLELRKKVAGRGLRDVTELFKKEFGLLSGKIDDLTKERRRLFYGMFFKKAKLMEGASGFVKRLKSKKLPMAIATGGHSRKRIKEILKLFNLSNYFSVTVSSDQVKKGKPYPDVYLFTAKLLSLRPNECSVIEDTVNGVLAGKAAGMKVFGVNKEEKVKKELIKAGADKVFSNLLEIKSL